MNVEGVQGGLSVAILSYNRPEYLREALLSVLAQSSRPLEVGVFDNGSGPQVKESIADLLKDDVTWMGWEPHSSVENFRRAFAWGSGKYLYVMHDDDRLTPDFFKTMCHELNDHPDYVAIACNGERIDQDGKRLGHRVLPPPIGDRVFDKAELAALYARWFLPFPSVIYVRRHLSAVRIKEEYGKQWDAVFLCDLAEIGPFAFLDRPLLEYRMHGQQDSAIFPEKQNRLKEDYVLGAVKGRRDLDHVRTVVRKQRAKRAAERIGKAVLNGAGPKKVLAGISDEGMDISRGWFLFYLVCPLHLAKTYMVRHVNTER